MILFYVYFFVDCAEQKELISNLAENGANFINGSDGASNNDDADHKDVYELYGVVNHLGKACKNLV